MSADFIDLDAVLAPDITVRLNGNDYKLPGDAPAEVLLQIGLLYRELSGTQDGEEILRLREQIGEQIEELFSLRNEITEGEIHITDGQVSELIGKLNTFYRGEGDDAVRPTSTQPKPRRRKPSQTSSARKPAKAASAS